MKKEHEKWLKKDPLPKFRKDLLDGNMQARQNLTRSKEGDEEIEEAIEFAQKARGGRCFDPDEDAYV